MYNFGAGYVTLIPAGANPTPVRVGVLKEVSIDIALTTKELRGAYQFPLDIARAAGKISGKAKFADINGAMIAAILTGATVTPNASKVVAEEAAAIPTTPFIITVTNGATFFEDMGVIDLTTGLPMTRGATATATGVYAVNTTTGAYTFNTADSGHTVNIVYAYGITTVGSKTISYTNQLMGSGSTFVTDVFNLFRGKGIGWRFPATTYSKLSLPFKSEDYTESDLEFDCFSDSSNAVLSAYVGN